MFRYESACVSSVKRAARKNIMKRGRDMRELLCAWCSERGNPSSKHIYECRQSQIEREKERGSVPNRREMACEL